MTVLLVIEERAGQHAGLCQELPYCKCGGDYERGSTSCFRCGRHIKALFRTAPVDREFAFWNRLVRERPYAEAA